ncbi:hypothetical protein ABIC63_000549 [Pseudacidovorax sp. 1753]|uniref:phage protein NinX family protein n=1 Tax=Pseudacidovorax sp. 1753 TaxID=3156419 RepID=UPI003394AFD6
MSTEKKVADLIGQELDYWVARAEGHGVYNAGNSKWSPGCWVISKERKLLGYLGGTHVPQWSPSTDPAQGQPIMERERLEIIPNHEGGWEAGSEGSLEASAMCVSFCGSGYAGATMLIAGMRARVAKAFGSTIRADGNSR